MKRFMVGLVIGIPLSSMIACACLIAFALSSESGQVATEDQPLSKVSWRAREK